MPPLAEADEGPAIRRIELLDRHADRRRSCDGPLMIVGGSRRVCRQVEKLQVARHRGGMNSSEGLTVQCDAENRRGNGVEVAATEQHDSSSRGIIDPGGNRAMSETTA